MSIGEADDGVLHKSNIAHLYVLTAYTIYIRLGLIRLESLGSLGSR